MNKYKRLISNTFIFAAGTFTSKVLVLLLMPLYTSILSTEQYGISDLITQTANLLIPLACVGICDGIFRFAIDCSEDDRPKVFSSTLAVILLGSAALVVPGISGSMILLILGYYNPIVNIITKHFFKGQDILLSLLVLGSVGLGICVGFIGISVIMKLLLRRYPRGTYFAIIGFIIGSIPTVYASTAKDAGMSFTNLPSSPWHWVACAALLALGLALSLFLIIFAKKKSSAK